MKLIRSGYSPVLCALLDLGAARLPDLVRSAFNFPARRAAMSERQRFLRPLVSARQVGCECPILNNFRVLARVSSPPMSGPFLIRFSGTGGRMLSA